MAHAEGASHSRVQLKVDGSARRVPKEGGLDLEQPAYEIAALGRASCGPRGARRRVKGQQFSFRAASAQEDQRPVRRPAFAKRLFCLGECA